MENIWNLIRKGNKITIYNYNENKNYISDYGSEDKINHWRASSVGGRSWDKEDIEEIFNALGL